MASTETVTVADNPRQARFEAFIDGAAAGSAFYARRDGRIVFTHTEVDDAFGGRGVGAALARFALDAARAEGVKVVPLCPFIAHYIEKHPDDADLVDQEMFARLSGSPDAGA